MIARSIASPLAQEHNYIYPDYFYMPYPTTITTTTTDVQHSYQQPGKRVKLEQPAIPYYPISDPSTLNPAFSNNMQQNQLSPVTVATPLSQHSPSRSPPRVSVVCDSTTPDWVLYDQELSTLAHDPPKDRAPLNHHHPSNNTSLQMEATLPNGYYAGFPTDFSKLSHYQQYLSPFTPTYQTLSHSQTIPHHSHTAEDEPPALSPPHNYQSSGPSVYDAEIRSPMTPIGSPRSSDGDRMSSARTPVNHIHNPKFTRTVSDAEEDELFRSSNIEAQQAKQPKQRQNNGVAGSMTGTLATFYQKAQNDHAMEARHSAPNQLNVHRGDSPFRANSPFHPMRTPQTAVPAPSRHSNFHPYMSIQARREHQKELDTQSMNEHMVAEAGQIVSTPKTISPKDAVLDYPEPEDESSRMSLFAHEHSHAPFHGYNSQEVTDDIDDRRYGLGASRRGSEAESLNSIGAFSYHQHSPQMPMLPSSFPYQSQSLEASPINAPVMIGNHHYPRSSSPITKPEGSKADSGAYTCTVPGCQQRFTSSLKLQKHKHQNHRQSTPVGSAGMTSTLRGNLSSRHQGPHRCTLINPQNGKPCNTVFSRPYDLTRHEDTIHNTTREKVRCEICNDEKTFSRQDALTRHKKVKHGIDK
ncbi:hypothetical protein L211DRAFT_510437 [Terfezia boudieri ATCC MYA-4762]|uniref:C2H2-type domain-containing protein n=1 Tax=Terfezia boudieri ATCC MYA-4762 TaxID=1051890 RepID=A0A3N4LFY5_9PEZI|nr:hypothetical protein L211DRAFT_510437 [Terfezia boudieri ATCC MYA-4762]